MPAPQLRAYPKYTVVAEKFHAVCLLGMANTRMKDYFDLWVLLDDNSLDPSGQSRGAPSRRGESPRSAPGGAAGADAGEFNDAQAMQGTLWEKGFVMELDLWKEVPMARCHAYCAFFVLLVPSVWSMQRVHRRGTLHPGHAFTRRQHVQT